MHKRFRIPEEFAHCTVVDSLDSQATDKPFTQTKQKLEEISMLCHFLGNQTERKRKKKKEKKRTMCTLRSCRVLVYMQPLLGRPNRTLVRSGTIAWDFCDEAQHTKTVRSKGKGGFEPERHGWSTTDIAFPALE